ncbi:hypothetical protein RUND412_009971 [Rhizina undulata]
MDTIGNAASNMNRATSGEQTTFDGKSNPHEPHSKLPPTSHTSAAAAATSAEAKGHDNKQQPRYVPEFDPTTPLTAGGSGQISSPGYSTTSPTVAVGGAGPEKSAVSDVKGDRSVGESLGLTSENLSEFEKEHEYPVAPHSSCVDDYPVSPKTIPTPSPRLGFLPSGLDKELEQTSHGHPTKGYNNTGYTYVDTNILNPPSTETSEPSTTEYSNTGATNPPYVATKVPELEDTGHPTTGYNNPGYTYVDTNILNPPSTETSNTARPDPICEALSSAHDKSNLPSVGTYEGGIQPGCNTAGSNTNPKCASESGSFSSTIVNQATSTYFDTPKSVTGAGDDDSGTTIEPIVGAGPESGQVRDKQQGAGKPLEVDKGDRLDSREGEQPGEVFGTKYEKSSGMAADGGDFDATRPGAGREADRLLEQKGVHRGHQAPHEERSENKHQAHEPKHNGHDEGSGEKKGFGDKIKDKLHLGHHGK